MFYQIEFETPKVQEGEEADQFDAKAGFVMSKTDLDQLIQRGQSQGIFSMCPISFSPTLKSETSPLHSDHS